MTLHSFDWAFVIEKLILIIIIVLTTLLITLYTTFGERKVAAILQDRPGQQSRSFWIISTFG